MAGYMPFGVGGLRPAFGPVPAPVVDRRLIAPPTPPPDATPALAPCGGIKGVPIKAEIIQQMVERRQRGETLYSIARAFGCTHATVRRHTLHVPPPPGGWSTGARKPKVKLDFAQRLRRAEFTLREIADEMGCVESTVHRALHGRRPVRLGSVRAVHRLTQHVARVSGQKTSALRAPLRGTGCKGDAAQTKARHILFWVIHRARAPITYMMIGRSLGGLHGSTVRDGVLRVEAVIAALGLDVPSVPARLVRDLWDADWPFVPRRGSSE